LWKTRQFLTEFEPVIAEENELLSFNKIFIERTAGVGILGEELAISYNVTGPNLRGSGVSWDLRKEEPYSGYETYDFSVPVGQGKFGLSAPAGIVLRSSA
jgi:NADH-quinone oxidoreductase subunit D